MKFGEFVKMNRRLKNLSKQGLVEKGAHLGGSCEAVSVKRLSEIENGSKKADVNQAKELANVLNFEFDRVKERFDIKDNTEWIDVKEANKIHNHSKSWIYPYLKNGDINGKKKKYNYWKEGVKKEGLKWFVDKKDLLKYLGKNKSEIEWIEGSKAAEIIGCSKSTIYDRYKKGHFERKKINGSYHYPKKEVEKINIDKRHQKAAIKSHDQLKSIDKTNYVEKEKFDELYQNHKSLYANFKKLKTKLNKLENELEKERNKSIFRRIFS